ncbi:universal stress protein [Noviherbaspirillum aridicola]|uniref:Universal stress protein A n=1 Tax=Noviherbaspirillum aridicola TaxID=2849687 RepID=A0ABQ4Q011_9BURK|nr:universal stress protein [Noviherbaspirillum aridicola]GIZ50476.1 universal stress protein A [Noviherbaspirillum aridicola]
MSYRTIAVHVNASAHTPARVELAARLAALHESHLVGMAATGGASAFYAAGLAGEGAVALGAYLEFMRESAKTWLAAFEAGARKEGAPSFEPRMIDDESGIALCLQARYSDLLVVGQPDPAERGSGERADAGEYALLNCGKPVLFVPYSGRFDTVGKRVVIAWDGSLEASRAVSGAIPLLRRADLVQVTVFDPEIGPAAHGEEPGADIALYLARHGVKVEVERQRTGREIDIGNALLSHLSDFGADLLVMGGYGHARVREILMGGVSRTVLRSMTVPVLMSH